MVKVEFLGPISKEAIFLDIKNLSELSSILKEDEYIKNWLPDCGVAINNKIVKSINLELQDGDVIAILPPVCGG